MYVCACWLPGTACMLSCLVAMRSRAHEHSAAAAATLSSTRATLDSSSTRTPVVAVVVLLRTARTALERTSMSRFQKPGLLHREKRTRDHDHSIAQGQRERETNTSTAWPSSHAHMSTQQQQQQQHPAALEQFLPRAALARLLLRLFYCCIPLEHELD